MFPSSACLCYIQNQAPLSAHLSDKLKMGEMRHRGVLIGPDGPDSLVKKFRRNLYKEFKDKLIKIAINFIKNI